MYEHAIDHFLCQNIFIFRKMRKARKYGIRITYVVIF